MTPSHTSPTKARIREFFARFFREGDLADNDDIFAGGYVNSMFAVQLIAWIEKEFGVVAADEDLELSNFNSVDAIDAFLHRKRDQAEPA